MEREKIGRIREMERRNTVMRLKWGKNKLKTMCRERCLDSFCQCTVLSNKTKIGFHEHIICTYRLLKLRCSRSAYINSNHSITESLYIMQLGTTHENRPGLSIHITGVPWSHFEATYVYYNG